MRRAILRISIAAIALAAAALGPAGCGDNPPVVYPTVAGLDESKLALGPRDKLELTIFYGSRETKATYTLNDLGTMEVQYIGTVSANGKTVEAVKSEIQTRLADGYLNDPIVSLSVVEINSLKLSVLGQVMRSGNIKFKPKMMITEAIAEVGGFSPMARKNMVRVTRVVEGRKETYKVPVELIAEGKRPNFPLLPGDEVFVPERAW
jgi:polysaccharide export outer membrane protein